MTAALPRPDQSSHWPTYILLLIFVLVLFAIILCIFLAKYFNLWIQAKMTLANVSIWELVGMSFRKVNPNIIVRSKIMAYQAGLSEKDGMTTRALEAHYLAGGNVPNVVRALIAANRADIPLSYKRAAAIDLAGRNVLEAVQTSVNPKVIPCPDPSSGRQTIDGVAKNGIQLKVKAKVTVRTNLDRLVGGATDETIIARVGEGIVNAIGSADTHKQVLEKPDTISKRVLEKGLDAGTAYEILSIDIADIDVGDNIGANLQAAPGRGRHAGRPAKAEERRAFAVAKEQEMQAAGPGEPGQGRRGRGRDPAWRSPRPSARATSASRTTTTCGTSRPTPRCGTRSPAPATPRARQQPASKRVRVGMDDGRGRYTSRVCPASLEFMLTTAEREFYDVWFREDCGFEATYATPLSPRTRDHVRSLRPDVSLLRRDLADDRGMVRRLPSGSSESHSSLSLGFRRGVRGSAGRAGICRADDDRIDADRGGGAAPARVASRFTG